VVPSRERSLIDDPEGACQGTRQLIEGVVERIHSRG
jgi:hypothetical protein